MWRGKDFFLKANEHILAEVKGYKECLNASNLQDWLDNSYAMAGYSDKSEYYDNCNPMRVVDKISQPCLFINAEDGMLSIPKIPFASYHIIAYPYHCFTTLALGIYIYLSSLFRPDPICVVQNVHENMNGFLRSQGGALALTATGSHCPFYEAGTMSNWAERAAYEFFDAALRLEDGGEKNDV